MLYLHKLMRVVKEKVVRLLPKKFALVFYGRNLELLHYVGCFTSFLTENELGYMVKLLPMASLEEEKFMNADEHKCSSCMCKVSLKKSGKNVVVVIGDSVNTNNSIANKPNIQLIGFASRRFNLAVKDIICNHEAVLGILRTLMVKLRKPL